MYNDFFKRESRPDELHLCNSFKDYDEFYEAWKKEEEENGYVIFEGRFNGWEFIPERYCVKFCTGNRTYEILPSEFFYDFWFNNPEVTKYGSLCYQVTGV